MRPWALVRRLVQALVSRAPEGPSETERATGRTRILVRAEDGDQIAEVRVRGPEAYDFTARSAAAIAGRIDEARPGFQTPSRVFGPDLLATLLTGPGEGVEVSS